MGYTISLIIENGSFIAIFLISIALVYASSRKAKTVPGANLLMAGFLMYAMYGLLAVTGPGFTGSLFRDFSKIGVLVMANFVYFLSWGLRAGMVLIIIGIYRMARSLQSES